MSQPPTPEEIEAFTQAYVRGLRRILGDQLYGIYQHGASVFPESQPVQDVDCHVILSRRLSQGKLAAIQALEDDLAVKFPQLAAVLDVYFILLEEARRAQDPQHQRNLAVYDHSWALHCAHIRAGYYRLLYGPEPTEVFPPPTWQAISAALEHELAFIRDNLIYPAYCTLNLCRILYSYTTREVAVSKQACGVWACQRYPAWASLIQAALRTYRRQHSPADEVLLQVQVGSFLDFALQQLAGLQSVPAC